MADLAALARTTLAHNRFMVLGTVDPSGRPRVSPVWFSLVDHQELYWLSSPDAHHSQNVEQRPEVSVVVFDSAADPHTGQAVGPGHRRGDPRARTRLRRRARG
ncbi:MAG: pyridoxamine 5'-phosphate oxidase family protein [Nocardioides sp.]